jgi:hypothetical protein
MSRLKTFRVLLLDRTRYSAEFRAASASKAIAMAKLVYQTRGTRAFEAVGRARRIIEIEEVRSC